MFDSVCFVITSRCNLSCPYCFRINAKTDFISLNNFEKSVEVLKILGTRIINITGGEPLLHPQWREFIDICDSANMTTNLITNGTLLDIDDEVLSKINILTISCDGIEGNVRNRSREQYEKVLYIIKEYQKKQYSFHLKINTVVTQTNIRTLKQFALKYLNNSNIIWMLFPYKRKGMYNNMPQSLEVDKMDFMNLIMELKELNLDCNIMEEHAINSLKMENWYTLVNADSDLYFTLDTKDKFLCNLVQEDLNRIMDDVKDIRKKYQYKDFTGVE